MRIAFSLQGVAGPHAGQPVYATGQPLSQAAAALVMCHGRGGSAADILGMARQLPHPGLAYVAPEAAGNVWYPRPFTEPLAANEPYLSSALAAVGETVDRVAAAGIAAERTFLLGFSQGACLILEYAARHRRRYGGVIALSGALIGPDGQPARMATPEIGDLAGTPLLLGCGDSDEYIPVHRVEAAAADLRGLGAQVTLRIYPGFGHAINRDEISLVNELLAPAARQSSFAASGSAPRSSSTPAG